MNLENCTALDVCEALGVELGEEFGFYGIIYRVVKDAYGSPKLDSWWIEWRDETDLLPRIIAESSAVIHTHWKAKDYDDADDIDMFLFPNESSDDVKIMKCKNGYEIHVLDENDHKVCVFYRGKYMFPSIKPGETVKLSDIMNDNPASRGLEL